MKFLKTWFILLIFPVVGLPESQVSISTADHTATIGDRVRINVIAKTTAEINAISLEIPKKDFEVISEEALAERKSKNYRVFETRLTVSFFSTGDFFVGPFEVKLLKNNRVIETKKSNSLEIRIRSVLEKNDRDIKALKNPVPLHGNPFYVLRYVLIVLLILGLIVFLVFVIRRRKLKKSETPEINLSPLEELQMRIKELKEKKLFDKGRFKPFFIRLTDIIKHYLCRQYHFNAEDLTTTETLIALEKKDKDPRLHESLDSLFSTSDLVKFAKYIPALGDYKIIEETVNTIVSIQKSKFTIPETQDVSPAV